MYLFRDKEKFRFCLLCKYLKKTDVLKVVSYLLHTVTDILINFLLSTT